MRFLVDNAVSVFVAAGLRLEGHDAVHVRDVGLEAAADGRISEFATSEDRIIVSADIDFGALLALRGARKPSFSLFRRDARRRPDRLLLLPLANLGTLEQPLRDGGVAVFEKGRVRRRVLPIADDDCPACD